MKRLLAILAASLVAGASLSAYSTASYTLSQKSTLSNLNQSFTFPSDWPGTSSTILATITPSNATVNARISGTAYTFTNNSKTNIPNKLSGASGVFTSASTPGPLNQDITISWVVV